MEEKKSSYVYRCVDKSIILQPYKTYIVSLFYLLVPRKLTANFITLISSLFMWAIYYLSINVGLLEPTALAGVFALLLQIYVLGDHLDGMHAKNTGTSSPLGEFMDHYFDIYNTAIFTLAYFILLDIHLPLYFNLMIWLSFVAVAATMVEELERDELYFGTFGTLEAIFVTTALLLSCMIPEVLQFWKEGKIYGVNSYWILIFFGVVGLVGTTGDILVRLKTCPKPFALYVITGLLLCLALESQTAGMIESWWVLSLYSGDYIGRVMRNYLVGVKSQPYPDQVTTIYVVALLTLAALGVGPQEFLEVGKTIFFIYLVLRAVASFARSFYFLREYWQWVND